MDIDGLGEENARRFLQDGLIESMADIYDLTVERLAGLEGFGEISARNLVEAIEASKEQPFHRVLYALGIPGIGYVNARNLARHFRSIDALLAASRGAADRGRGHGPDHGHDGARDAGRGAHARAGRAPARATA